MKSWKTIQCSAFRAADEPAQNWPKSSLGDGVTHHVAGLVIKMRRSSLDTSADGPGWQERINQALMKPVRSSATDSGNYYGEESLILERRQSADLTGFAALLGDSFRAKIDLLTQIIQGAHYPSLGRYKERLLSKVIQEYIPKNLEVGTGFVLFVHEATEERARKPGFDALNMGSHSVSKQCDVIVYDSSEIPVVFRDDDFVVVRPESVRAVIEVKGSANTKAIGDSLRSFLDFGQKWQECQLFYKEHHQQLTRRPSLYVMCWGLARDRNGHPLTNGTKIREQVANFYRTRANLVGSKGFPRLSKLFIYNECEITETGWLEAGSDQMQEGYATDFGQFVRYDPSHRAYAGGDRTIASLLAGLHYVISDDFNRFYSYTDETRELNPTNYEHHGFTAWLLNERAMRDANTDWVVEPDVQK